MKISHTVIYNALSKCLTTNLTKLVRRKFWSLVHNIDFGLIGLVVFQLEIGYLFRVSIN